MGTRPSQTVATAARTSWMVAPRVGAWASRLPVVARLKDRAWVVHQHLRNVLLRDPSGTECGQDVIGDVRISRTLKV